MSVDAWKYLAAAEQFPLLTKIDDDMIRSSMVKCIERHIMSENTHRSKGRWRSGALEVFQIDPETVGGVWLHISLELLLVVSLLLSCSQMHNQLRCEANWAEVFFYFYVNYSNPVILHWVFLSISISWGLIEKLQDTFLQITRIYPTNNSVNMSKETKVQVHDSACSYQKNINNISDGILTESVFGLRWKAFLPPGMTAIFKMSLLFISE